MNRMSEITSMFNGTKLKACIEIPKIFISDFCRGNNDTPNVVEKPIENIPYIKSQSHRGLVVNNDNKKKVLKFHNDSNFIYIYATVQNYIVPEITKGSLLTQSLQYVLGKNNNNNNENDNKDNLKYELFTIIRMLGKHINKLSSGYQRLQYSGTCDYMVYLSD